MKDHQLTDFNQKGFVSFTPEESFVKKILNLNAVVDGIIPTYNQPSVPENATCYGSAISQRLEDEIPQEKKIDNVLYGKTTVLQTHYFPDEFIELIEDPYILKIAKAALNSDNVVLHNGSLSSVYPGNTGNGTMYHSDTSDFCNPKKAINLLGTEKKIINIMILFSDIEENLAPMKVLEGSHLPNIHKTINDHVSKKLNMLNTMDNTIQGNWIYEELLEDFNLNEISFTGKVGDIGVMNSNLLHKASENFSEVDSRKVLILNFGREEDTCFNRRYPYKDSKEFYKKLNQKNVLNLTYKRSSSIVFHLKWKIEDLFLKISNFFKKQINRIMNPNVVLSKINYYFYSRFSSHKKEYLNLGGGVTFEHVNFFKLDVDSRVITDEEKGVYNFDLTKDLPLPFSDGSIVGVYTSHCIEHLTEAEVAPIFLDSYRVLKSGGTLRVVVPNMAEIFDAYDKREASYFQWLRDKQTNRGQIWVYDSWIRVVTRMFAGHVVDCLNDTELKQMYTKLGRKQFVSKILSLAEEYPERWGPGSHKSAWTPDSMKKMLENAGFKKIELSQRGQSKDKIFRNLGKFDTTMPNASLFIEAHK